VIRFKIGLPECDNVCEAPRPEGRGFPVGIFPFHIAPLYHALKGEVEGSRPVKGLKYCEF